MLLSSDDLLLHLACVWLLFPGNLLQIILGALSNVGKNCIHDLLCTCVLHDNFMTQIVLQYHPNINCWFSLHPHDCHLFSFMCTKCVVPGGAIGVDWKWKGPLNALYADFVGLAQVASIKLRVMFI